MISLLKKFIIILLTIGLISCGNSADSGGTSSNTSVGTIVNPISKPSSLTLSFQSTLLTPPNSETHCSLDPSTNESLCSLASNQYQLNILKIYLIDCQDEEGNSHVCSHGEKTTGDGIISLYDGDLTSVIFSENFTVFPSLLETLDPATHFSMIQFNTTYIQQTFPFNETSVGVIPELEGKTYRICTTSEKSYPPEQMAIYCGNSEALMGDTLFDLDDNGTVGFLIQEEGKISESLYRPSDYTAFQNQELIEQLLMSSTTDIPPSGLALLTGKQPPNQAQVYSVENIDWINLLFVTTKSIRFSDADHDGIYNPLIDKNLKPQLPTIISGTVQPSF